MNKKLSFTFCFLLFIIFTVGCISDNEDNDNIEDAHDDDVDYDEELSIEYFVARPGLINVGFSANLTWSVTGATNVSINNNIGSVGLEGWYIIFPKVETTYTLTASNSTDEIKATTTIYVIEDSDDLSPSVDMTEDASGSSCVITIISVSEFNVLWSDTNYTFVDIDKTDLNTSEVIYPSLGVINIGDEININNLEEFHEYRFTMVYKPTDYTMGIINWFQ